jgi:hypothetical protein
MDLFFIFLKIVDGSKVDFCLLMVLRDPLSLLLSVSRFYCSSKSLGVAQIVRELEKKERQNIESVFISTFQILETSSSSRSIVKNFVDTEIYKQTFSKKQIMKKVDFFDYDSPTNIISIGDTSFVFLKENPNSSKIQSLFLKKNIVALEDSLTEETETETLITEENETIIKKEIVVELNLRERKKQHPKLKQMRRIFNAFATNEQSRDLDLDFRIQTLKTVLLGVRSIPADQINYKTYVSILIFFEALALKLNYLQMIRIYIVIVLIYEKKIKISKLKTFTEADILNLQPDNFSLLQDENLLSLFKTYVTEFFSQKNYLGQIIRKSSKPRNSNEIVLMSTNNFSRLIDNHVGSCTIPLKFENTLSYRSFYI